MAVLRSALSVALASVIAGALACGGEAGKPTADDSRLPRTAQCEASMGCFNGCLASATRQYDLDACTVQCPLQTAGGEAVRSLYACRVGGRTDCFSAYVEGPLGDCLDPLRHLNLFPPNERIAAIPPALVGAWRSPTATLTIDAGRHVVYENWAPLEGCKVVEHLEGTASTQSDGTLVIDIALGVATSYLRDCHGDVVPRSNPGGTFILWYAFRIDDTTVGTRLSLDRVTRVLGSPAAANTVVKGWGEDYFYRQD